MKIKHEECGGVNSSSSFNNKTLVYMKKNGVGSKLRPINKTINKEGFTYICSSCNELVKTEDLEEAI